MPTTKKMAHVLVAVLLSHAISDAAAAQSPRSILPWRRKAQPLPAFAVKGMEVLSAAELAKVIGKVPERPTRPWLDDARHRVLTHYRAKGYTKVRAWVVQPEGKAKGGQKAWALHIDEGKMHTLSFVGADTLKTLVFRVELYLPKRVFHLPTLRESLERIRKKYNLRSAYFRVRNVSPKMAAPNGRQVPRRELRLYFLTRESFGWGVGLSLSSTYGLVPRLSVAAGKLLLPRDRLAGRIGLAFPYREYLFSESTEFTWVHGYAELDYRLSRLKRRFTPRLSARIALSRLRRTDIQLDRFLLTRTSALAYFDALVWGPLAFELGLGYGHTQAWDHDPAEGVAEGTFERKTVNAFVSQLKGRLSLAARALRRDMQSELSLSSSLEYGGGEQWVLRNRLWLQYVLSWGHSDLIFRLRGETIHGTSNYWDHVQLSDFIRVEYDNRYWIEEVATATVAFRLGLTERLKFGIFHDVALFGDRSAGGDPEIAIANAFGPSLHWLFFDAFSLDVFYGFGFGPVGFDHQFVFSVKKVF